MSLGQSKWFLHVLSSDRSSHVLGHVCNMCCSSAEALSAHLEDEHLGSGKGSYTCRWENCTRQHKPFTQRQKAIRHIRTHTGLKAFKVFPLWHSSLIYFAPLDADLIPHTC
jgi:hypothetical protein